MIVQRILAAGGLRMELAARHTTITPWLCKAALGHGAPKYSEHLALL